MSKCWLSEVLRAANFLYIDGGPYVWVAPQKKKAKTSSCAKFADKLEDILPGAKLPRPRLNQFQHRIYK